MPKKKISVSVDENTDATADIKVSIVGIQPLELHADLGRQDLNEIFKKVEDKINEIIRKI